MRNQEQNGRIMVGKATEPSLTAVDEHGATKREAGSLPDEAPATTLSDPTSATDTEPDGVEHQPARLINPKRAKIGLMICDAAAFGLGTVLAFVIQRAVRPVPAHIVQHQLALVAVSLPVFAGAAIANHLYRARANERFAEERKNILLSVGIGVGFMLLLAFALKLALLSRLWMILLAGCTSLALTIERAVARRTFRRLRASGRLRRRIVIVGTDPHAIKLLHTYQRRTDLGYDVVGFVGEDDLGERGGIGVLGKIDDLERVLAEQNAVGVVISLSSICDEDVNRVARQLTDGGYHVSLSSSLTDIDIERVRPQSLDGRTMIYVERVVRDGVRGVAKRTFDLAVASAILLASAPVWIAAMIAIKLDSRGPVFFKQERVGQHGEPFTIMKFRTMVVDAEERKAELMSSSDVDGPIFKMYRDPRITRVGRVLRKFSIDELPQLFSVIKGEMSMVGPRPALPSEAELWEPELFERLRVLPGLTGLWQVSGRSDTGFDEYRRLDLYYVHNWSLGHDVRICARTVGVVLSGRGAA